MPPIPTPDNAERPEPSERTVRALALLMIVSSMSVVTARLADAPVMSSANDRSRWCTVWALVERNTYQIDEIHNRPGWSTIDQVRHQGHFYSSKPPLLPRMVAELYRGLKAATGWTLTDQPERVTHTLLFLINVLPMGISLVVFFRLLQRLSPDCWTQLFVLACACWGELLLPFLTAFNNHTVAASCFFLALPLAAEILIDQKPSRWNFALCGILTAFGVCNELPAALLGLSLFGLLLRHSSRPTLTGFLPGALLVLAAFFITNYQATGSLKPFYSKYGTETYEFVHEGIPSYWKEPRGIDRPRDSTLTYLWHCTFGHHGIFSLSPIFLLTLAGWVSPGLWWKTRWRWLHLLGLGLTVVTLGFYLTKTANYNYGGVSVSLRWMMWLTPFWLSSLTPVVARFGHRILFRGLSLLLLSVSIFSAWYPAEGPWTQNWLFQWMARSKWIDYSDPPPEFSRRHYSWIGALPDGPAQPDYFITFQSVTPEGETELLRLEDGGPASMQERLILVERTRGTSAPVKSGYLLKTAEFRAGDPVESFLSGRQDGQPLTEADRTFFRGMPQRIQYVSSRIRYERSPLRTDAFRCHVGYTYVTVPDPRREEVKRRLVRDVWYTEELPFGVLRWDEHVENVADRKRVSARIWEAVDAGEFFPRASVPLEDRHSSVDQLSQTEPSREAP